MYKASLITATSIVLVVAGGIWFSTQSTLPIQQCKSASQQDIIALFDRWNDTLKTGDPDKVVQYYAPNSLLLPTLSNQARITLHEKKDYFFHFLEKKPVGEVSLRVVRVDCNTAIDTGNYTFTLDGAQKIQARYTFTYKWSDGQWLISSHHSSLVPSATKHTVPGDQHKHLHSMNKKADL